MKRRRIVWAPLLVMAWAPTSLRAQTAQSTQIMVRVTAHDAKIIGLGVEGARVTIMENETGGAEPRWSRSGQLTYALGSRIFLVDPPAMTSGAFGQPRVIFDGPKMDVLGRSHDVSPIDDRLLVVFAPGEETVGHLNVVMNWFAELNRLAPHPGQ